MSSKITLMCLTFDCAALLGVAWCDADTLQHVVLLLWLMILPPLLLQGEEEGSDEEEDGAAGAASGVLERYSGVKVGCVGTA
jgi:hypothetical protein